MRIQREIMEGASPSKTPWRTKGSHWVGKEVRRSVYDGPEQQLVGFSTGRVTGWLPAEESEFVNDSGELAPLWHVRFENGPLEGRPQYANSGKVEPVPHRRLL